MTAYYELIEHTADIGVLLKAPSLKALFEYAAQALFETCTVRKAPPSRKSSLCIRLEAEDRGELLVDWLNELLYVAAVKEKICIRCTVTRLTGRLLEARCVTEPRSHFTTLSEIKAATYSDLEIKKIPSGWQAKVIFDV